MRKIVRSSWTFQTSRRYSKCSLPIQLGEVQQVQLATVLCCCLYFWSKYAR